MKKICIELDDKVLNQVESILGEIGMNSEEAIKLYFTKIKNDKSIPFHENKGIHDQNEIKRSSSLRKESKDILNFIDSTISRFHNDPILKQHIKPTKFINNKIHIPEVFQPYVLYILFKQKDSAVIRKIPFGVGYIVEKIEGQYYVTRDYGERPIGLVQQDDINRFGNLESMSEEEAISFVEYFDIDLGHFGI